MKLNRKMVVCLAKEIKSTDGKRVYPKGMIVEIGFDPGANVDVSVPGQLPVTACLFEIEGSMLGKNLKNRLGENIPKVPANRVQKFQPNIDELKGA